MQYATGRAALFVEPHTDPMIESFFLRFKFRMQSLMGELLPDPLYLKYPIVRLDNQEKNMRYDALLILLLKRVILRDANEKVEYKVIYT